MTDELEILLQDLQSDDDRLRSRAIDAISKLTDARAGGLLIGIVLFHERAYVRYDAILALEKLNEPDTTELLMQIASDVSESVAVRCRAIKALGYVGNLDCLPLLEDIIDHAADDIEVQTALNARGNLKVRFDE